MSRCASGALKLPTLGTHPVFKLQNKRSIGALFGQLPRWLMLRLKR